MRILKLTSKTESQLLLVRERRDRDTFRVSARIVDDVKRRGDAALNDWSERLDGIDISGQSVWVSASKMKSARRRVSKDFLSAVEHAAHNVQRVAQKQMPRPWSFT